MQKNSSSLRLKLKASIDYYILYLILLNQIVITITGWGIGTYFIFTFYSFLCLLSKRLNINQILIFMILPNKYLQVLGVTVIALKIFLNNRSIARKNIFNKTVLLYFIFSITSAVINCMIESGTLFISITQIAIYMLIFVLIAASKQLADTLDKELLNTIFVIEILTSIIQLFIYRQWGDSITGTLFSAHWLGVFLTAYAYYLCNTISNRLKLAAYLLCIAVFLFLSDAKHVYICFGIALIADHILSKIGIKKKICFSWLTVLIALFALMILFINVEQGAITFNHKLVRTYILNSNYNKKYQFFKNTMAEMVSWRGVIGHGLGLYGSQVCISFAKAVIYPWRESNPIFSIAAIPYKEAITGVMTEWYVNKGIRISSMVLGYPLVSLVAIVAENGIIGMVLLTNAIEKVVGKYKNAALPIMLFLLCFFDTYFEIPCVIIMLFFVHNVVNDRKKKQVGNYR